MAANGLRPVARDVIMNNKNAINYLYVYNIYLPSAPQLVALFRECVMRTEVYIFMNRFILLLQVYPFLPLSKHFVVVASTGTYTLWGPIYGIIVFDFFSS